MLVQILSFKSEKNQHFLMVLVFFIFIFYSCYTSFELSLLIVIPVFIICVLGIVLLMRSQLKNRTFVHLQVYFKADKRKVLKTNMNWVFYPFLIYSFLTVIHFLVVFISGKSIMPLVYDYGIGGALALGLKFFMSKNWSYGVCDDGIVVGSKFDSKLIQWENIEDLVYDGESVRVNMKKYFPTKYIVVNNPNESQIIKKLLEYKVK